MKFARESHAHGKGENARQHNKSAAFFTHFLTRKSTRLSISAAGFFALARLADAASISGDTRLISSRIIYLRMREEKRARNLQPAPICHEGASIYGVHKILGFVYPLLSSPSLSAKYIYFFPQLWGMIFLCERHIWRPPERKEE